MDHCSSFVASSNCRLHCRFIVCSILLSQCSAHLKKHMYYWDEMKCKKKNGNMNEDAKMPKFVHSNKFEQLLQIVVSYRVWWPHSGTIMSESCWYLSLFQYQNKTQLVPAVLESLRCILWPLLLGIFHCGLLQPQLKQHERDQPHLASKCFNSQACKLGHLNRQNFSIDNDGITEISPQIFQGLMQHSFSCL